MTADTCDVLVVGAGPAGLSAAHAAAAGGASVLLVDDNPLAGGQIWRGGPAQQGDTRARALWQALQDAPNVSVLAGARVLYALAPGQLCVQTPTQAHTLHFRRLVLATGARERLLPFPGWTLPGVTGAGGLQALVKGGYPVAGKRVVVAGSGPLLLAAAATLKARGAQLVAIVEQAALPALTRFALSLAATPSKAAQALQLTVQLRDVPRLYGSYVRSAHGEDALQSVQVVQGSSGSNSTTTLSCDYLACGYGLIPNLELAHALGCATAIQGAQTVVQTNEWQQTSMENVYCAGEATGIGGVDLALAEGTIAGLAASALLPLSLATASPPLQQALRQRRRWQTFAARLERAFALRPELSALAVEDTIVCRCEDVCHGQLRNQPNWRSAKLQTRCGMGPCQGRICGGATELLYGWRPDAVRMPIAPARVDTLTG